MGRVAVNAPCPCGTGRKYKVCCGPLHEGTPAPDAERLMRSRYSAYALGLVDYVVRTTHPKCPEYEPDAQAWANRLLAYCRQTQFLGLQVLEHRPAEKEATVSFCVTMQHARRDVSFCEKSRFVREGAAWLYRSGETRPVNSPSVEQTNQKK